MEIRGKSTSYSSFKKNTQDKREKEIINEMNILEENPDLENIKLIDVLKEELSGIRKIKMDGIFIRSRAQDIEDGEKPSKFFCSLESHNYLSKIIPKIEMPDGKVITNQQEILQQTKLFYENLYTSKDDKLDNIDLNMELAGLDIPKLTDVESNDIEGLITYEQAKHTLLQMKNNKSPGSDGYTADFFKVFWNQLGHFVVRSINYGYKNKELSITQKEGIITVIHKDNKPRHFLKNYRPISLLNGVYKIASGSIAYRIKSVLNKLIHGNQTGFMSGRYTGENTRIVYDFMTLY